MDYDYYNIGYAQGLGILGGHWYSDPYNLFTDWKIDRVYDASLVNNNFVNYNSFYVYVYYTNINPSPQPDPIPVPEPSSFILLISGLLTIFLFKNLLTRADK